MTFSFVLVMGNRGSIVKKETFPVGLVCDVRSVCDALTGRNVTSAAGSRIKDTPQPTQTHSHTSQPEKDVAKGQWNSNRGREGCPLLGHPLGLASYSRLQTFYRS